MDGSYFIRKHVDSTNSSRLIFILCFKVFELADDLGGRIYIDLNTGPYYAAVISSHGYPAGNDTKPIRANGITNMDQGVYSLTHS